MSKNIIMGGLNRPVPNVAMAVTSPTTNVNTPVPVAGAPCAAGRIPGIAESTVDAGGLTVLNHDCIADVSVLADDGGASAVVVGDLLYIGSTGVVSKLNTGVKFGTAFGASQDVNTLNPTRSGTLVSAAATKVIQVWVGNIK